MTQQRSTFTLLLCLVLFARVGNGFQVTRTVVSKQYYHPTKTKRNLSFFDNDNDKQEQYSRKIQLREEVESPFSKVRFFIYVSLAGGAFTSLAISLARIAAALSGVNPDLLQESVTNAAVDVGGLVLIGFLLKRDLDAKDSRLKRASKGAELAKLKIRASRRLLRDDSLSGATVTTSLSSLRRGRGIEKRVVIAAAGQDKMDDILKDASELNDSLVLNDLLVVPVLLPQATSPSLGDDYVIPESVALPAGEGWKAMIDDETSEARSQGVDVESEGISIILKKNGRVGQRTKGVFLGNMVGEVVARRESGMDVSNI